MAPLIEWRGDLKDALDAYQTFEQTAGIILTHCRLGDRFLRDGLFDQAKTHYRAALKAAVETAEEAGDPDKQGLALALFRQAELYWRQEKGTETSTRLQQALEKLSAENEAERKVILQALKLVEAGDSAVWPQWRWQLYDDAFRISLLFDGESDS
jgi:hypothetical protein